MKTAELYEKKIEKLVKLIKKLDTVLKDNDLDNLFPDIRIELSAIDKQIKEAENTPLESQDKTTADYSENQKLFFDIKKFIINRFGLPADVSFNKCPKVTYFEIYELIKSFASQQRDIIPDYDKILNKIIEFTHTDRDHWKETLAVYLTNWIKSQSNQK